MTSIRMKYVKQYRDRTGKLRHYLRHPHSPRVPLPGPPGSRQFMAAYEAGLAAPESKKRNHKDGTIGDLVAGFYQSSGFKNLAPSSQQRYRLVLDKFARKDGHRLVRDMPRRVAISIIEEIGETTPGMANLSAAVMRRLFAYAIKKELRKDNPFAGIEPYKLGTHHTWTDAEIAAYESAWQVGTRERLAFDLLLYSGQRVGDVAAMRRSNLKSGVIHVTQEKTGVKLEITLHPNLLRSLKDYPANGLALIGSPHGRPMTAKGLSAFVKRSATTAGLPSRCTPHGLRKALMTRLAHHGSTTKEIASMSGHKSLKEVERYTAAADQALLARSAIARLPEEQSSK
jgi:integrase